MVYKLYECQSLAAHCTVVNGMIRVSFYLDNTAVSNMDENTTATVATAAITRDYLLFFINSHISSVAELQRGKVCVSGNLIWIIHHLDFKACSAFSMSSVLTMATMRLVVGSV